MRILTTTAILIARAIYAMLGLLPRRNKVVMLSRQGDRPSKDFILLAEELVRTDPSLEVAIRCRFIQPGFISRVAYVGEILAQMYHLATSRACVLDSYCVPLSILNHQDELFVVQLWHALGAIKKFGYQSIGQPGGRSAGVARDMRMHRNYDAVLCGGPGSVATFASAFDVDPRIVLPLGLPRVDYLREAQRSATPAPSVTALRERYPRLADESKTIVLYAPTFRWNGESAYRAVIDAFAASDITLVIKPHDLDSATVPEAHVVDATGVEVFDLLPMCDVVLTDYSAVAFEAACIDKPVYFYVYDVEEYATARGLNLNPLEVMPGVSSTRIEDLVSGIAELDYNAEVAKAFLKDFAPPHDARCTAEIGNLIFSHLQAPR